MCTVTWIRYPGGYRLFFNRDELDSRGPEEPPHPERFQGVRCLLPRDTQSGGTWIGVNEFGLTLALLNDYESTENLPCKESMASRGLLILDSLSAATPAMVFIQMRDRDLRFARPFRLLALHSAAPALLLHWNGRALVGGHPGTPFLSSSSFLPREIVRHRQIRFQNLGPSTALTPSRLRGFHRRYDSADGAASVLMRRTEASTRSLHEVRVDPSIIRLRYQRVVWNGQIPRLGLPLERRLRPRSVDENQCR